MKLVRAAILTTALAVTLMPTSAFANRSSYSDAHGDVVSGPVSASSNPTTKESTRTNSDITWSTVVHKRHRVVMKMQFRDIAWNSEINSYFFVVKTPSMKRYVTLYAADGVRGGKAVMTKPSNGKTVKCRIGRSIDYTANNVTVSVPRSCLGTPRWVRVGMASVFYTDTSNSATVYIDDARTDTTLGSGPALGPKVRR